MDPVFDAIQQNLNSALSIPFVSSAVTLGLAFYAYKAAPELPSFMEELFLNVFFRVFIGFMVLYMGTGNVLLSLVVSVVFIYGVGMLSGLKEGMLGDLKVPDLTSGITSGVTSGLSSGLSRDLPSGPPGFPLPFGHSGPPPSGLFDPAKEFLDSIGLGNIDTKSITDEMYLVAICYSQVKYPTSNQVDEFHDKLKGNLKPYIDNWLNSKKDSEIYVDITYNDLGGVDVDSDQIKKIINGILCGPLGDCVKNIASTFGDELKNKNIVSDDAIKKGKIIRNIKLFNSGYYYHLDDENVYVYDYLCKYKGTTAPCNLRTIIQDSIKNRIDMKGDSPNKNTLIESYIGNFHSMLSMLEDRGLQCEWIKMCDFTKKIKNALSL